MLTLPVPRQVKILQLMVFIGAFIPVLAGLDGMINGGHMLSDSAASPALDSHLRYLSGLLFAIGLGFWSCIPGIVTKTARVRVLSACVVIGGLARLIAVFTVGWPGIIMVLAIVMELVVTPALCLWQNWLAKKTLSSQNFM